jgi:cell division protein FtsB
MSFRVMKEDHRRSRRRSGPKPPRRVGPIVRLLLLLFAALIVVDALVGDQGLLAMRRARQEYRELEEAIARKQSENDRRREEVRRLKEDPGAIEDAARRDLGLIRRGEKVFFLKDVPSPDKK